jgi:hypothetical protein
MVLAHDGEQPFRRDHFLRSGKSMLEHGALAGEVDILFGERVAAQIFNKRAKPIPFSCSQYDSTTSWKTGSVTAFEKHFGEAFEQFSGHAIGNKFHLHKEGAASHERSPEGSGGRTMCGE